MRTLSRRAHHGHREREMATLRTLHVSLPDSLTSQAIMAPPAYTFRLDSSQESSKTKTAAFT